MGMVLESLGEIDMAEAMWPWLWNHWVTQCSGSTVPDGEPERCPAVRGVPRPVSQETSQWCQEMWSMDGLIWQTRCCRLTLYRPGNSASPQLRRLLKEWLLGWEFQAQAVGKSFGSTQLFVGPLNCIENVNSTTCVCMGFSQNLHRLIPLILVTAQWRLMRVDIFVLILQMRKLWG